MHISIVGAGALGLAYGVWAAAAPRGGGANAAVSYVVRRGLVRGARVERVGRTPDDAREVREVAALDVGTSVAPHADVIVVTVRADQLARALETVAAAPSESPVVILTPIMPAAYARARAILGDRVRAAMPGVVAYVPDDGATSAAVRVRAWFPAPTLLDEQRGDVATRTALTALAAAWTAAGLTTRFAMGLHESNPATTAAFIPLAMAVDAAGSLDALVADESADLLSLAVHAAAEGSALGARLGHVMPWAALLTGLAQPWALKLGIALMKRRAPEAFAYVDHHFGRKLHAQNVAMARELVELATARGEAHAALEELHARLAAAAPAPAR